MHVFDRFLAKNDRLLVVGIRSLVVLRFTFGLDSPFTKFSETIGDLRVVGQGWSSRGGIAARHVSDQSAEKYEDSVWDYDHSLIEGGAKTGECSSPGEGEPAYERY